MSTGLENYDPWKCSPPFNPDEREAEEPCEACEREVEQLTAELGQRDAREREVEQLTAELGQRDARLEALEIELAAIRKYDLARLIDEVGKRVPGSFSVSISHGHYLGDYGVINRAEFSISWWPTEDGQARNVRAYTADATLAAFHAALETRS